MHLTPDDIAASIGADPTIKPEDLLYKYLGESATVRFDPLREHFASFGLDLTEDEMVRLMAIQQDILFTEGSDDRGRFWRASIVPDHPTEGYLDHRIEPYEYDDEDEFSSRELQGINAPPEAGQMNELNADAGAFDAQPESPDVNVPVATPAVDQTEIPPAAIPRAMPDIVAQAMGGQMLDQGALEPTAPEPSMVMGPVDQVDMGQPPAQPGPGEERPAPQTGPAPMAQAPMGQAPIAPMAQAPIGQAPIAPIAQAPMAQTPMGQAAVEPQLDFGDDGADYTIDPFLNAFGGVDQEGTDLDQSPQATNEPATGAHTRREKNYGKSPQQYSARMRESWAKRQEMISEER